MILRAAHLAALERAAYETFVDRLVEHVASTFRDEYARRGEAGVRAVVEQAIDFARDVAIETEVGICRYAELWFRSGVMCDRADVRMQAVLDDGSLDEERKLEALEALARGA